MSFLYCFDRLPLILEEERDSYGQIVELVVVEVLSIEIEIDIFYRSRKFKVVADKNSLSKLPGLNL